MAWQDYSASGDDGDGAFELIDSDNPLSSPGHLLATSTASVMKDSITIRMFNINPTLLTTSFHETMGVDLEGGVGGDTYWYDQDLPPEEDATSRVVMRMFGVDSSDTGSLDFVVDFKPGKILQETMVPSHRVARDWNFTRQTGVSFNSDLSGFTKATDEVQEDCYVLYKDPNILKVPDTLGGGYLMLAGRYRIRLSDLVDPADEPTEDGDWANLMGEVSPEGSNSIGDIVGWFCPDAEFRENVVGPILLLDSLHALQWDSLVDAGNIGEDAEFPTRWWLGVPSGVFVGNTLYLYCAANPSGYKGGRSPVEILYDPYLDGSSYKEKADLGEWHRWLLAMYVDSKDKTYNIDISTSMPTSARTPAELLVRSISGIDLANALRNTAAGTATPEGSWTYQDVVGYGSSASAPIAGRTVRIWSAEPGGGGWGAYWWVTDLLEAVYGNIAYKGLPSDEQFNSYVDPSPLSIT